MSLIDEIHCETAPFISPLSLFYTSALHCTVHEYKDIKDGTLIKRSFCPQQSECSIRSYCNCGMSQRMPWIRRTGKELCKSWNRSPNQHLALSSMLHQHICVWDSWSLPLRWIACFGIYSRILSEETWLTYTNIHTVYTGVSVETRRLTGWL